MGSLDNGERQVAPTIYGIRRDHVARYEWLADRLNNSDRVLDIACGVGYGSRILADWHRVVGVDRDAEAVAYAKEHYAHENITYLCRDAAHIGRLPPLDAIACFETLEHIAEPQGFLRDLRSCAPKLYVSVPNETVFPYGAGIKFHARHYTKAQLEWLLLKTGWRPIAWHGQEGTESDVVEDVIGRTLIAECDRCEPDASLPATEPPKSDVPKHVSIVGLGPSDAAYLDTVKRLGGRRAYCDETWVINAHGQVLDADLVFHMDDVRVQEIRAKARPDTNIARMLDWLKTHPGPIMTSRAHPDYPGLVEFPLEDVLNKLGYDYFNSTAAYAIAYAVFIGVEKLSLWGFDFTYPSAHDAEKGRGCCEYWIGVAMARGIKIAVPKTSTLLDAYVPADRRLYGYDTVDVKVVEQPDQSVKVEFTERETLPSADEIERAYDHSRHPSADLPTVA